MLLEIGGVLKLHFQNLYLTEKKIDGLFMKSDGLVVANGLFKKKKKLALNWVAFLFFLFYLK